METIIYFTLVLIIGFFAAMLELAFQAFMQPNMVFYPWAVFLMKLSQKHEILRHLTRILGRCRYCNGTWIGIYAYLYFFPFDLRILFVIGITFMFIRLYTQYLFTDIDANGKVEALFGWSSDDLEPTPVKPMLQTYVIMGCFYSTVYLVIPYITKIWMI
jgi:hypothetical protein